VQRLFKSATVLDPGGERGEATRVVDILVDGTRIGRIADYISAPENTDVVDASRCLITPGLVNTHGHLAMTLLRGFADEVPLNVWLQTYMFPREARMNGDDIYFGTLLALAEGVMSGTTTFADMYFFEDDVARAVEEAGVRANLSTGTASLNDEPGKLRDAEQFVVRWNNKADGRIKTSFGPHTRRTRRLLSSSARTLSAPASSGSSCSFTSTRHEKRSRISWASMGRHPLRTTPTEASLTILRNSLPITVSI
jgi:5-methylthioadenosine/S-adenosylhomocysteine deaminase